MLDVCPPQSSMTAMRRHQCFILKHLKGKSLYTLECVRRQLSEIRGVQPILRAITDTAMIARFRTDLERQLPAFTLLVQRWAECEMAIVQMESVTMHMVEDPVRALWVHLLELSFETTTILSPSTPAGPRASTILRDSWDLFLCSTIIVQVAASHNQ